MGTVMFLAVKEHEQFFYNGYHWLKTSTTQAICHALRGVYSFEQSALVTLA